MPLLSCRYFSGYRPCQKSENCDFTCSSKDIPSVNIVLIHLGALGSVVRSTALLAGIRKKYPRCRLFWVTDSPAHHLLRGHHLLDQVFSTSEADLAELSAWNFDLGFVIDKSRRAAGLVRKLSIARVFGFQMDPSTGAIIPANPGATELWEIGLSDERKFFVNKKTELQLIYEALELGTYDRPEYDLPLSEEEGKEVFARHERWQKNKFQPVVGFNTGASHIIPAKKWTVSFHRKLMVKCFEMGWENLVLLGGEGDTERNKLIAHGLPVISSPTTMGLRDGLVSLDACDIVVSGDSLGMHMAIARKKYVIAWFGPTCSHEIELYDRGEKLLADVNCSPCWKRICDQPIMCYDRVSVEVIQGALERGQIWWEANSSRFLLFRPPFLAISC